MSQVHNPPPAEPVTALGAVREALRRPVPHIVHTPELEAAAIAVQNAKGPEGNPLALCGNPLDVNAVRDAIGSMGNFYLDPAYFAEGAGPAAEINATDNLILLATLLREHLRAGNIT